LLVVVISFAVFRIDNAEAGNDEINEYLLHEIEPASSELTVVKVRPVCQAHEDSSGRISTERTLVSRGGIEL